MRFTINCIDSKAEFFLFFEEGEDSGIREKYFLASYLVKNLIQLPEFHKKVIGQSAIPQANCQYDPHLDQWMIFYFASNSLERVTVKWEGSKSKEILDHSGYEIDLSQPKIVDFRKGIVQ